MHAAIRHELSDTLMFEQAVKEGKVALNWTRPSRHDLDDNQVRLSRCIGIRVGIQSRELPATPGAAIANQALHVDPGAPELVRLIKTGAKVVFHSRYVTFQLAEVALPRRVFAAILARIRQWAV